MKNCDSRFSEVRDDKRNRTAAKERKKKRQKNTTIEFDQSINRQMLSVPHKAKYLYMWPKRGKELEAITLK